MDTQSVRRLVGALRAEDERDRAAAEAMPGAALRRARRAGYPDAVPGSRAAGRGRARSHQRWVSREPNPYSGEGEPADLMVGSHRTRREASKHCRGGLLPVLVSSSAAGGF